MKNIIGSSLQSRLSYFFLIVSLLFQTGFMKAAEGNVRTTSLVAPPTFADVPADYWAYQYIEGLYKAAVTGGCSVSPRLYCPEATVTRAQMAVFLERGTHGSAYNPPTVGGSTGFDDVPPAYWAAAWIKQFAADGVTAGCGSGTYCPDAPVTRAQMAVFLLRSKHGSGYTPPITNSTVFTDVPPTHWAAAWIKQLVSEGITAGCGASTYCPESPVTRAQMAVFLVRTFNLSLETLLPIIPITTKILPPATTQYLSSVSGDGSVFTFSQTTAELSALSPGQVIVGQATSAAPYGFLRKVEAISNNGSQVILQTQPATIEEAVQQGEISISQPLSPSSLTSAEFASGVQPMLIPTTLSRIDIQLNNVVLYDSDGNENTTDDQVIANGSVSLEPMFNFKLKVQDFHLEELYFTMTANEISALKISSKVFVTARAEKVLATYPMGPLFLAIGAFPITVYPVLTVVAGIDGTISANVSTGVTQTLTTTSGLSYIDNNWSPIQQFSNKFDYDAPMLTAGLSIKGYTGTKLKILFYGSVGPDISINAYLKLEANPLEVPWWNLYAGLEVPVGISIDIFSHVIAGYSAVVIDYRILLLQANTPPSLAITEYALATFPPYGSRPSGITVGPDGAIWFAERFSNQIGRITSTGTISEFPVPSGGGPWDITTGPDGALWFTKINGAEIGRITTAGVITEFSVPILSASGTYGITAGPDNDLWFTVCCGNQSLIGRITTSGTVSTYALPTANSDPTYIALGPDNALWFTENGGYKIGRITTAGVITEFPVPFGDQPYGITLGPDNALWFTAMNVTLDSDKIGRITTTGTLTLFPIPTKHSMPEGITLGPDGALWFIQTAANQIGRITTSGTVAEFTIPTAESYPVDITLGSDGALWFTEYVSSKIGKVLVP